MEITKDKLNEGRELAEKRGFKKLFVNEKGEFFTDRGMAMMSVDRDADKVAEVPLRQAQGDAGSATNDLDKAAVIIAAIEAAETEETVEAIKKAEVEGKNRSSIIKAADKKLETLSATGDQAGFKKAE